MPNAPDFVRSCLLLFITVLTSACASEPPAETAEDDGGASTGTATQEITAQPDPTCTYARYGVHDYWACSVSKTFSAAKSTCEGVGMHLARIDNASENDFIKAQVGGDSWIGATDSAAEGTWRWLNDGAQFWSGKRPGNVVGGLYNRWNPNEPNDLFGEDCAALVKSSGEWNDIPCSLSRSFVCESSPATDGQPQAPDTACTRTTRNGSTYWTCSNARTWDTARANCQSIGMDLVAIDDASESTFLAPSFTRETHIGLTDRQSEGTWRWTATDRPSFCGVSGGRTPYGTYSNWSSGQPIRSNDCQKVESETRSYWICRNEKTWDAARDECAGAGMTLARIDDAAENALIAGRIAVDTWIGGSDRSAEGQWRWMDNIQFWSGGSAGGPVGGRYTNFQTTEPNDLFGENCLLMYLASGKWNDSLCDAPLGGIGFACEGPKGAGHPDRNDCAFAASGGKWTAGTCNTGRAYVCESVPANAKPQLEDITSTIRENHALGSPRVLGFEVKAGVQVKEPFVGQEERLGLRACTDGLEPADAPAIVRSTGLERVNYRQTYEGVPVLGRGYTVFRHPQTKAVQSVLGDVAPNLNVSTTPVFTQAQALQRALAAVGTQSSAYNPTPVGVLRVVPKRQGRDPQFELAWVYSLPPTAQGDGYAVGVSAITGNVLLKTTHLRSCVLGPLPAQRSLVPATVNAFQATSYLDPSTALVTRAGSNASFPNYLRSTGTTLDPLETPEFGIRPLFGKPEITATCGTEALDDFAVQPNWSMVMQTTPSPIAYMPDGVSPPTDEQAGAAALLALQTSLNAVSSVFENKLTEHPASGPPTTRLLPWLGIDGFGTKPVNLHVGAGGDLYSPQRVRSDGTIVPDFIHIQTFANPPGRHQGAALDVVAHELGHALWMHHAPALDPDDLESRAIQEGFADIIADTVEAAVRLPKTNAAGRFCQGGDPWGNASCDRDHKYPSESTQGACMLLDSTRKGCCVYNAAGGPIRGGCPSDYQSAEYCKAENACAGAPQTEACCDEHTNATVFDHWQYLVTAGDSRTNASSCKYRVEPLASDPLESSKAAGRIVFNAVRDGTPKTMTYPVMAEATIKAATDLFGAGSAQVKSVTNAWHAVNVRERPFETDAPMAPKRGARRVHPWVTFAWPAGEGETAWDLQIDDNNFRGPSPRFEESNFTTSAGTGASRLAYYSVAFPENVNTHYVWRVRPHGETTWDCFPIHWFDGTGPLTEPTVTLGNYTGGLLTPGLSYVFFPQMPGVLFEALKEYRVQFSQQNVACQETPGVPLVIEHVHTIDGPLHVVPFPGTQPGATYYAHVQAVGPPDLITKQPARGPCVNATGNSGPPLAPTYLKPSNGERFNLLPPHERDPETPSQLSNLEIRWSVESWMKTSRVRFFKRTETGCESTVQVQKIVETPTTCATGCPMSLPVAEVASHPYPGGYCWEVVGIGAPDANGNAVESPPARGSWTYYVNMATNRTPGVAATSGSPGSLGRETYGKPLALKWETVPSATGYRVKVWPWLSAYGTEQLGNPTLYPTTSPGPILGAGATQLMLDGALTPGGRYCWELTPLVEDPQTPGMTAAVQPKINAGGPICFTTGPAPLKKTIPKPPARGFDGKDIEGEIEFDYIPDLQYWTNVGEGWNWVDSPEPWCTTFNQVYRDVVKCKRKLKVPAVEGKTVRVQVKAYEGRGAPGSAPSGSPVFTIDEPVPFGRCGGNKEACCPNRKCDAATLACDGQDNCVGCGVLNAPCCPGSLCNTADLACAAGNCATKAKPDLEISVGQDSCGFATVDVTNVGDAASAPFMVTMDGVDCCNSLAQRPTLPCPALAPGGVCHLTHHYTCMMVSFVILADSTNTVAESNESNNLYSQPTNCVLNCL